MIVGLRENVFGKIRVKCLLQMCISNIVDQVIKKAFIRLNQSSLITEYRFLGTDTADISR